MIASVGCDAATVSNPTGPQLRPSLFQGLGTEALVKFLCKRLEGVI